MPRMGNCEICGDEFIKVNRVRKYCVVCQGIRDTEYAPRKSVNCTTCGKEFWPLKRNYASCNDCREPAGNPEKYSECKNCGRHLRPAPGLEAFCMSCVQSSAEFRLRWLKTVVKKRNARLGIS